MFSDDLHAEDKLLVLLALEILDTPVTGLCITDLLLGPGYMNYFDIQTAISELVDGGYADRALDGGGIPLYSISEKGRQAFRDFSYLIPEGLAVRYEDYITKHSKNVKKQLETDASIFVSGKDEYFVRCFIRSETAYEFDLTVPAAGREDANAIARRWKSRSSELFGKIISLLHEGEEK